MNLYVSNLDRKITEEDLKKLFSEYGAVSSVKVITDYATGVSRGFAFLEMSDDQQAGKAMEKLNNQEVNGRAISVQVARPKEDRPKRSNYPERDGYKKY